MKEIIAYQTKSGKVYIEQYKAEFQDLQDDLRSFWPKIGIPDDWINDRMLALLKEIFVSGPEHGKPISLRSFYRKIAAFRRRYAHCEHLFALHKQAAASKPPQPPKDEIPF